MKIKNKLARSNTIRESASAGCCRKKLIITLANCNSYRTKEYL